MQDGSVCGGVLSVLGRAEAMVRARVKDSSYSRQSLVMYEYTVPSIGLSENAGWANLLPKAVINDAEMSTSHLHSEQPQQDRTSWDLR